MNIKESFERVGFTPEEKMALTARLKRAAEQEQDAVKHNFLLLTEEELEELINSLGGTTR